MLAVNSDAKVELREDKKNVDTEAEKVKSFVLEVERISDANQEKRKNAKKTSEVTDTSNEELASSERENYYSLIFNSSINLCCILHRGF